MSDYQTPEDFRLISSLIALAPAEGEAFLAYDHACKREDGQIPLKYRELISLAVALTTQCAYCLDVHSRAAAKAGVTRGELAETAMIAAAVRAGGSLAHALLALRLFDRQTTQGRSGPSG
jgi:AhpD family alkylhydroperoxidase